MNVQEILRSWLTKHGYDGLFNGDGHCACLRVNLMPCCSYCAGCEPGYLAPCDCGDHNWHIVREKPEDGT